MASAEDIAEVRLLTNEPAEDKFDDAYVGGKIDSLGVLGATAHLWEAKAAEAAELVNVNEAGASHAAGDLYKQALAMQKHFQDLVDVAGGTTTGGHVKVRKIVRS